jgi:hypothetical protein
MTKTPHLTAKQLELLRVIAAGNDDGTACDLDQILDRIRYRTSKGSLHFSLRILIERGLVLKMGVETRRGAKRRLVKVTPAGKATGSGPRPSPKSEQDNIVELGADILSADLEPVFDSIIPDIL